MLKPDSTSDNILNDKTNYKEEEPFENSLSVEIRILSGHLDNLYSDQDYLNVLSRHLARRTSQIPELSDSGQLDEESLFAALNSISSLSKEETSEKPVPPIPGIEYVSISESPDNFLERMLDITQSDKFPSMQSRCNSSHWQSLNEAALAIEDALLSLSRYQGHESVENYSPVAAIPEDEVVESQSESERLEAEISRRIAKSTRKVRDEGNPETDGFYLSRLQRELESLVRLVRCTAISCSILSDFNAANIKAIYTSESDVLFFAKVSRAIANVSKSLGKRAGEIETISDVLLRYVEDNPGTAPKASVVKEMNKFCLKLREDWQERIRHFTPREIGLYFLERDEMTVRRVIQKMEDDKDESFRAQGYGRIYTRQEAMQILFYYLKQPGRRREPRN